ncbi:MAG: hypothetical protein OXK80_01025 [Bdellovibrionales bacterium]|nr:hypothetical protein [Bdellovibrionales bacterium]
MLNSGYAFSADDKVSSDTEAGAVCLTQDCPSTESSLQTLQNTASDQLCSATKEKPECKGIEEKLLKGCLHQSSAVARKIDRNFECVTGLGQGVVDSVITLYQWIKESLPDGESDKSLEDPGLKAYLHAEFESASQDSGTTMAVLETTGSIFELLWDATGDVYSCLNPIGVIKKVCQFIGSVPVTGIAGGAAGPLLMVIAGVILPLLPAGAGVATGYQIFKETADSGGTATFPVVAKGAGAMAVGTMASGLAIKFMSTNKGIISSYTMFKTAMIAGAVLGVTAGSMATHDKNVKNRIRERIKNRVQEFKEQEESQKP